MLPGPAGFGADASTLPWLKFVKTDKDVIYRAGARERSEVQRNEISIESHRDLLVGGDGAWPCTRVDPDFRCNVECRLTIKEPYLQGQTDAR